MNKIKELLDETYTWPCPYTFKFIVPGKKIDELKSKVGEGKLSERPSKKGTYIRTIYLSFKISLAILLH